jgi:methionyl-tRNA formyltransferase
MSIVIPAPQKSIRLIVASEKNLRICFFGTPLFAVPALRALASHGWPLAAVITAPDKPVGRRMLLTPSPVKTAAQELGIPVLTPQTLKDDDFFTAFSELRPDVCVVVAYGKLIPERYLKVPRLGFLNIHPSLLPAYRGPSPIQGALLDGCASTGVSLMLLDNEMDHGPVLTQIPWVIPGGADYPFCEDMLSRQGAQLLVDTLPGYIQGTIVPVPQDHALATTTAKFTRQDGCLDWTQSASRINDRIRALASNPGTWTLWEGKTLNILHAHIVTEAVPTHPIGTVFSHAGMVCVSCGDGALALETVQLEGSTRQSVRDFVNGRPTFIGALL